MILKYLYTRPDGGVSIVGAAPKETLEQVLGPLTDSQYEAHFLSRSIPVDAANLQRIPDDFVAPIDRTFRNAWEQVGTTINVNLAKARDIQERRINDAQRLKIRDILEREALGENVALEKANIGAVNARGLVNAAQTPDQLKATMPAILK